MNRDVTPYYQDATVTLYASDAVAALRELPEQSIQTCITSPPYWGLRDYGVEGQLGLEPTPEAYVAALVGVFREVWRVLRDDGTLWLNLGDSYAGSGKGGNPEGSSWAGFVGNKDRERSAQASKPIIPVGLKPKDLVGIPWRVAFALQADGWWLRSDIIWAKPNPMPESVTDRPTKAHEYLFLLAKRERYYYDAEAIKENFADERMGNPGGGGWYHRELYPDKPHAQSGLKKGIWNENGAATGRNRRSVWEIATQPYPEAHFATFPVELVKPCVLAGSKPGDTVLDPFAGSGTACYVAKELGRQAIGIDLNPAYLDLAAKRLRQEVLPL